MSDQRRLKSTGSRYDVDVSRHPDRWRLLRSRLSWIFAVGTAIASIPWLMGDHRVFQSECVSDAHRGFGQNCQACHDQQLIPLQRMVTFDNLVHSTSDKKCQKCHRESSSDHLLPQISGDPEMTAGHQTDGADQIEGRFHSLERLLQPKFSKLGCAGCHREHRGHSELAQVVDVNCTNCHTKSHREVSPRRFELGFKNFRHHPEFAIWREPKGADEVARSVSEGDNNESEKDKLPSSRVGLPFHLAKVRMVEGTPIDQTAIKFSHHRHLDPKLPTQGGTTTELRCADCHQAEQSGAYFRPIQFEQHCHRCHILGFPATGELPHVKPELIRGILLNGLAKNSNATVPRPQDGLGGPTMRPIDNTKSPAELLSLVKDQLEKLEQRLFDSPQDIHQRPQSIGLLEAACTKCHFTERTNDADIKWRVTPPQVPDQWMSHNRFRHDRHLSVECALCHTRQGQTFETVDRNQFYPVMTGESKNSASIYASVSAKDILMPRIDVCHNCHGHDSSTRATVTDKCVDCHSYHHVPAIKFAPSGVGELLNRKYGRPAVKSIDPTSESNR